MNCSCYALSYPNPFNPNTKISFSLAEAEYVVLKIYDILGREVYTMVNEKLEAGIYDFNFNASHLSSGLYICKINAGKFSNIKKMQLIK